MDQDRRRRPAIIFDFGNVIAFFDYRKATRALGARIGMSADEFLDHARGCGLAQLNRKYESGQISSEEFSAELSRETGLDVGHEEFSAAWSDIFDANPPVIDLVRRMKAAGYTLVLGSNTSAMHSDHFRRVFADALAPFDGFVLSHQIGFMKPSREFYAACADAAGRPPDECVFIDDMIENVEGARSAGLIGLQFHDVDRLATDLESVGVEMTSGAQRT